MAAHRYWRGVGLETYGDSDLELSEFHLLSGLTRVDGPATLTASTAPSSGSLANLKDDDTSTGASWAGATVKGLIVSWDFGVGGSADVTDIRVGSAASNDRFLLSVRLQWSDDAVTWSDLSPAFAGIAWPGARTKTVSDAIGAWNRGPHFGAVTLTSGGTVALHAPGSTVPARPAVPPKNAGVLQIEWEWITTSLVGSSAYVGFTEYDELIDPQNGRLGRTARGWSWGNNGAKTTAGSDTAYGATWTLGDVLGAVVDFAAGSITFYKNGVSQGAAFSGLTFSDLYPGVKTGNTGPTYQTRVRTKGFTYPVAGATAWEDRETSIATNRVRGKVRVESPMSLPSLASIAKPLQTRIDTPVKGLKDYVTGVLGQGIGRVRGFTLDYVNPLNKPYPCRVVLMRETGNLVVREQWSKADGSYDFQYVDELQSYTVVAYYLAHSKRAVITDGLTLANGKVELMA
jgi:hypothetical protein